MTNRSMRRSIETRRRGCLLFAVLLGAIALGAVGEIEPPDTGKLAWGLFETVSSEITRAGTQEPARLTALLTTRRPVEEADLALLRTLGYTVLGSFGRMIEVEAPADLYVETEAGLDSLDFVLSADFPPTAQTNDSPVPLDSAPVIEAEGAWNLGYRGEGTRIAVIERGYTEHPALDALAPTCYVVSPGSGIGTYEHREGVAAPSPHGTSCALIAGGVAPDAELYLLSFASGDRSELDLMDWLACLAFAVEELAVDVVTTQIWFDYPTCHADGTGVLAEAVDEILAGTGASLVVAAGNWADGSGSSRSFHAGFFGDEDGDSCHDFDPGFEDPGNRNDLRFRGHAGDTVLLMLEWDDWEAEEKTADLDLLLYFTSYDRYPVGVSRTRQAGRTGAPSETLEITLPYDGEYSIVLEDRAAKWHEGSSSGVHFHLYLVNGTHPFLSLEHHSAAGSLREIATSRSRQVVSVGAVAVDDPTSLRTFSSRGPTWDGRCKPDLYAPDGIGGTLYESFFGTSASAPHVAGAIAVLRSVDSGLSPIDAVSALRASAGCLSSDGCGCWSEAISVERAVEILLGG